MGFLKNLLGLGVAAGTAYAAVKVAQKYNEKKNANADLNGDGDVYKRQPPALCWPMSSVTARSSPSRSAP